MHNTTNGVTPGARAHLPRTNEKAAGVLDTPATARDTTHNDLDFPTSERAGKAFATLAAQYAMAGHTLTRSNPADGPVRLYAHRWGMVRNLPTFDAAERFLTLIGVAK